MQMAGRLKELIRDVPDFPREGIVFKDITPLLAHKEALRETVDALAATCASSPPDIVVGVESRGFIFGAAVAVRLGAGFVPVRKPGKLPWETISERYDLEYGSDAVEIHADAVKKGTRALLVDDLLATGGTAAATSVLLRKLGAEIVGASFVIELEFLKGRSRLKDLPVNSLVRF